MVIHKLYSYKISIFVSNSVFQVISCNTHGYPICISIKDIHSFILECYPCNTIYIQIHLMIFCYIHKCFAMSISFHIHSCLKSLMSLHTNHVYPDTSVRYPFIPLYIKILSYNISLAPDNIEEFARTGSLNG